MGNPTEREGEAVQRPVHSPSAFPSHGSMGEVVQEGMTLRDYFAAKAMQALISGPDAGDDHYEDDTNEYVSVRAYLIANAMLKAREQVSAAVHNASEALGQINKETP